MNSSGRKQRFFKHACQPFKLTNMITKITRGLVWGLCLLTFACTKDKATENKEFLGKWRLIEIYDSYFNGGSFTWKNVPAVHSHDLVFGANSHYEKRPVMNNSTQVCVGTYIRAGNSLAVQSNCNTATEQMTISSPRELIIDRHGIEGIIRYKYKAEKP